VRSSRITVSKPDRMTPDIDGNEPDEMARLLRERLPRHQAPSRLRASVVDALDPPSRRRPSLWLAPALSALATAMVMLLWLAPSLPHSSPDQLQRLSRAVVSEYARAVFAEEVNPGAVPASLPRVMKESGVLLPWVFTGDQDIQLINAQPAYLEGGRALALTYQDRAGHSVSYIITRAPNVTIPDRERVQIARWRPAVRTEDGFALIVWKQAGLVCVMVSDLVSDADLSRFKEYFIKVRSSTEVSDSY
jgi:hypothetical protein